MNIGFRCGHVAKLTQSISQLALPPSQEEAKKRDGGSFGAKDCMPKEELVTVLFTLKALPLAQKELDKMDKDQVQKIYDHIEQLKIDPFRSRPGMNIDKVAGKQRTLDATN